MEKQAIRLECLKLAVSKSPDHGDALLRAKEYVDFVENTPEDASKQAEAKAKVGKESGNLDSLIK